MRPLNQIMATLVLRIRLSDSECLTITDIRSRCLRWMLGLMDVTGDELKYITMIPCRSSPLLYVRGVPKMIDGAMMSNKSI